MQNTTSQFTYHRAELKVHYSTPFRKMITRMPGTIILLSAHSHKTNYTPHMQPKYYQHTVRMHIASSDHTNQNPNPNYPTQTTKSTGPTKDTTQDHKHKSIDRKHKQNLANQPQINPIHNPPANHKQLTAKLKISSH